MSRRGAVPPRLQNGKKIESAAGILVLGLTSIHEALVDLSDRHVDSDQLIAGMFTEVKIPQQSDGAGER
ncbi:hypothetical protein ACE1SV_34920 [Streptomyces sp. E-15]